MGKGKLLIFLVVVFCLIVAYQLKGFFIHDAENAEINKTARDEGFEDRAAFEPFWGVVDFGQETALSSYSGKGENALDGLSFDGLSKLRLKLVDEYNVLGIYPPDYHLLEGYHSKIYGQIEEYQNWMNPAAYFFTNPYELIIATQAPFINPLNLACPDVSIVYDAGIIEESHLGINAVCWFDTIYRPQGEPGTVWLFMVNAWDAGFRYAHVDVGQSENVLVSPQSNHITNSVHSRSYFYHVGQYGVNNISPRDKGAWVTLRRRGAPTLIYVKLWQTRPKDISSEADLVYVLKVLPE